MVYFSALMPNPAGAEAGNEWIALQNDGTQPVFLDDWSLKDESGKVFIIRNLWIEAGAEIRLGRPLTKIVLGNSGDALTLYDATGKVVDYLEYRRAVKEEEVLTRKSLAKEALELLEPMARFDATALAAMNPASGFWFNVLFIGAVFASVAFFISKGIKE
jgi:hypothetical protein